MGVRRSIGPIGAAEGGLRGFAREQPARDLADPGTDALQANLRPPDAPRHGLERAGRLKGGAVHRTTRLVREEQRRGSAFPSLDGYRQLQPLLAYYHLKGGQAEDGTNELRWRSSLEDASWPVGEITRQVAADEVSPVVCLNGSHGRPKEGYDYSNVLERDLAFVRREINRNINGG